MNSFEKKQIKSIEHRIDYLNKKLQRDIETRGKQNSFDLTELAALKWAVSIILNWFSREEIEGEIKDEQ